MKVVSRRKKNSKKQHITSNDSFKRNVYFNFAFMYLYCDLGFQNLNMMKIRHIMFDKFCLKKKSYEKLFLIFSKF